MSYHGVQIPADPVADREDWLEKRRVGVGASDVSAILGLSPWSSPFEVWVEKTQEVEKEPTEAMDWGLRMEDVVIEGFESRSGLFVGNRQTLVHHPDVEWAMATLDGLVYETLDPEDDDTGFSIGNYEGKTDGGFGRWNEIPDHYQIQIQWQLWVTGHDHTWCVCLHNGRRLEVYEVERDDALIGMIVERVTDFRDTYLTDPNAEPPPVDGIRNVRILSDLWDVEPDKSIELASATVADLAALRLVKAEKKRLEDEEKRLSSRIKVSLQDAEIGLVDGVAAVTWKQVDRKGYEVKPSSYRQLSIKDA